jgi:hypothetical protein
MIYLNVHRIDEGVIIAMCDEGLVGQVLEEGNVFIDLKLYSGFYKGELVQKDRAKKVVAELKADMNSANIVGKEAISVGLETGIIEDGNVGSVSKVPYAHAYKVRI